MQRLEVCVSFGPKIPKIPIVVPGRVLVKEGEAHLIENKGKTKVSLLPYFNTAVLSFLVPIPSFPHSHTDIPIL